MKNSNKVIVLAMLFVSTGNVMFASQKANDWFNKNMNAQKGLNLDEIKIKNEYDDKSILSCQLTWKDRNGAHGTLPSTVTVKAGNNNVNKFKGPLIGYGIYKLEIYSNGKRGEERAGKNRFFVVKDGGSTKHPITIVGYKNEKAYRASLIEPVAKDTPVAADNDDSLTA